MRVRAVALLAGIGLAPAVVSAEELPAVGVLDVRPGDPALAAEAENARAALERALGSYRVRVQADHPAVSAAHAGGKDAALAAGLATARARLKEGQKLFEAQDPRSAERKFREAADLFEANAAGLTSNDDLVGTYLYLARIFFATQRELLIRDVFKQVVQLNPDLILDRAVYPGGMIRLHDEVKAQILGSPLGTLHVDAVPGPARVFLDGKDRGVTPLDLQNIPPGVHALTVRRAGFAPFHQKAEVTSFRTDRTTAVLVPDRHPELERVLLPKGTESKDSLGLTITDYLDAVSTEAALDLAVVGRLTRTPPGGAVDKGGADELAVRVYAPKAKAYGDVRTFRVADAASLDRVAQALLLEAAGKGWVPPLAARRNVAAGGGALDPTAPLGLRVAASPAFRIVGNSVHFPRAPSAGFRAAVDYRLASRFVVSAETGFDGLIQEGMELEDDQGQELDAGTGGVGAIYTSIPVTAAARWYLGVRTWAPFLSGGAGITYDSLAWRESLRYDRLTSRPGIGFGAFAGLGVERALAARSALTLELRTSFDRPAVGDAKVKTRNIPGERVVPVDPGTGPNVRASIGYLRLF